MVTHIAHPNELTTKARELLDTVIADCKNATKACVIGLSGELGAGKTAFVKEVARSFGVAESVTSPTFVIEKIYALPNTAPYKHLIHIDAYRLSTGAELVGLGFADLVEDPQNLILIEWPEHVVNILPPHTRILRFTVTGESSRDIELTDHGKEG